MNVPTKLKQLMADQSSLDTDIAYQAKKALTKALYGEVRYSPESLHDIQNWDKTINNETAPAKLFSVAEHSIILNEGFVISPIMNDKYAKCLLNLDKINNEPTASKKCMCDLTTVLMVTGCVCGGE